MQWNSCQMRWSPDTVFIEGLGYVSDSVAQLGDSHWQRPSPCEGWTALDILGHVGTAVGFGTRLLSGEHPVWSPREPPGAAVVGDPRSWWDGLVPSARQAVADADLTMMVESPAGRRSVADGLSFPALDLFIHAWDLVRCVGGDVSIPSEAIEFGRAVFGPIPVEQMRSRQVFGDPVTAPRDATDSEIFIAWTGRDPRWTPSAIED